MSDCGGCAYFTKIGGRFPGGICGAKDARTTSDRGHRCQDFRAPKHDRLTEKRQTSKFIKAELATGANAD
jgi:hypothetical protein